MEGSRSTMGTVGPVKKSGLLFLDPALVCESEE